MNSPSDKSRFAVLVNSCDKYSDTWPIFFNLFFKYWPDCPYPIYLGSNHKEYPDQRIKTIQVGDDHSWAESTRQMLEKIDAENVLWFLDDFFIWETVDTKCIKRLEFKFKDLDANYLKFRPTGGRCSLKKNLDEDLFELLPGIAYRTSLDVAFWRKEIFIKLLKDDESPWEMEHNGSRRSDNLPGFYGTRNNIIFRTNGLERGKWLRYNLPLLKREGLEIPIGHPIMSLSEHWQRNANRWFWNSILPLRMCYRILKRTNPFG